MAGNPKGLLAFYIALKGIQMIAYKLLSQNNTSYNNTKWELNKPQTKPNISNPRMCSNDVLHCYAHPLLAAFFNSIHANIKTPKLFEIKIDKVIAKDSTKQASLSQTLLRQIPLPIITHEQRTEIAIRCAYTSTNNINWKIWADNWLNGRDRSRASADAATASSAAYAHAAYAASAAASSAAPASSAYADYTYAYAATAAATASLNPNDILKIIQSVVGETP
jgi:hypothetical protein